MTISELKAELNTYREASKDIQDAIDIIRELEIKSTAAGSLAPKDVQVITSLPLAAKWENMITDKVDLEQIVGEELQHLEEIRDNVMALIRKAGSAKGRVILVEYYINGSTNEAIADKLDYDVRTISRIKRKALKQIAKKMSL